MLAWTATGLVAWSQVKSKLHITVQEDEQQGDDRLALLGDRIEILSGDLDVLVKALGGNFELLAQALASEGERSAVEAAVTAERLAVLERALPSALQAREAAGGLQATLRQLQALVLQLESAERVGPLPPAPLPIVEEQVELASAVEPESEPVPEVQVAVQEQAKPSRGSFLAFSLPDRDFQFEGDQHFEILTDLSRVGFDAKTTLHDFTGISEKVSGSFDVDLAHPEEGLHGEVRVRAESLLTGLEGRDEAMLEHLQAEQNPDIVFELLKLRMPQVDASKRSVSGELHGRMSIRGKTVAVSIPVSVLVDDARRLVIEGEAPLHLPDFDIPVPNKLGVITMEEDVNVWVRLRARARAQEAR